MKIGCLLILAIAAGCTTEVPANSSFKITSDQARQALTTMRENPKPLARPVVVIGGFWDPNFSSGIAITHLRQISPDAKIIQVCDGFCGSFDECRAKVIAAVDQACPCDDPQWTSEVDVVGLSLGGLVARYAAAPSYDPAHPRRLRIARLFTISSPQRGATLAQTFSLCEFHRDMRPESPFLQKLAQSDAEAKYKLFSYVHLNDEIVGATNAAPPGVTPWWLPNPPLVSSHLAAMCDARIFADIGRRLRSETPFTTYPAAALPEK